MSHLFFVERCTLHTNANRLTWITHSHTHTTHTHRHNFVHTDLHPGNILVRMHNPVTQRPLSDEESGISQMLARGAIGGAGNSAQNSNNTTSTNNQASSSNTTSNNQRSTNNSSSSNNHRGAADPHAQIILLDFGLAEELTPRVRRHFVSFLNCIASGDGVRAAEHILQWGQQQNCPDPRAFTIAMDLLFDDICRIHSEQGIDLDQVRLYVCACNHLCVCVFTSLCLPYMLISSAYLCACVSLFTHVHKHTHAGDEDGARPCLQDGSHSRQLLRSPGHRSVCAGGLCNLFGSVGESHGCGHALPACVCSDWKGGGTAVHMMCTCGYLLVD